MYELEVAVKVKHTSGVDSSDVAIVVRTIADPVRTLQNMADDAVESALASLRGPAVVTTDE